MDSNAGGLQNESPPIRGTDRVALFLWVAVLASTLALCLLVGFRREAGNNRLMSLRRLSHPLQYGQRLPDFQLATTAGTPLASRNLHGKWTLLVFGATWCEACSKELHALARQFSKLNAHVDVVPVMQGETFLSPPVRVAQASGRNNGLPFKLAVDPQKKVGIQCGASYTLPYSVLLDAEGRVRLVTEGHTPAGPSSLLADALLALFCGTKTPLLPPIPVHNEGGSRSLQAKSTGEKNVRLSFASLSAKDTLVVTFLAGGSPQELRRTFGLLRYSRTRNVRFLFITASPSARSASLISHGNVRVIAKNTAALFKTFHIQRGPVSLVFHHGRQVLGEDIAQPDGSAFESQLAYIVLLSEGLKPIQAL